MSERRCLYCVEVIPEGRMVCPSCVAKITSEEFQKTFAEAVEDAKKLGKSTLLMSAEAIKTLNAIKQAHTQELKTLPEYFQAVKKGLKTFEVRSKKDRTFKAGEYLKLREWTGKEYTGDAVLVRITYVLDGGQYGIDPDCAVIGFHFAGGGALD